MRLEARAHVVRLDARREIAAEVTNAQVAVASAEEMVFKNLPSPLPEKAAELAEQHPVVAVRRHQLERLEQVYAPVRIEQAEAVAKAMLGESTEAQPAGSLNQKPPRRTKPTGTEGGTP
ncbi:MAG: hypothetical protein JNM83_12460 [Myxococcales bacterium]|nr:hypothetical protein [Myxococcales bacterium]